VSGNKAFDKDQFYRTDSIPTVDCLLIVRASECQSYINMKLMQTKYLLLLLLSSGETAGFAKKTFSIIVVSANSNQSSAFLKKRRHVLTADHFLIYFGVMKKDGAVTSSCQRSSNRLHTSNSSAGDRFHCVLVVCDFGCNFVF